MRASFRSKRTEKAHFAMETQNLVRKLEGYNSPHTKSMLYRKVARYTCGSARIVARCLFALFLARWMRFLCGSDMMLKKHN